MFHNTPRYESIKQPGLVSTLINLKTKLKQKKRTAVPFLVSWRCHTRDQLTSTSRTRNSSWRHLSFLWGELDYDLAYTRIELKIHTGTHIPIYKYIAGKNTSRYCYANLCILRNRHRDRLLPRTQTWSTVEPTLYLACICLWKLSPHFLPHPREINRIFVRCIWFYEIVQYLTLGSF